MAIPLYYIFLDIVDAPTSFFLDDDYRPLPSLNPLALRAMDSKGNDGLNGDHGAYMNSRIQPNLERSYGIVAFISIALYNVLELSCIIFTTFKKRKGLYFTSFCVSTWGTIPFSIAFLILTFYRYHDIIYSFITMIVIGWACMATGQSLVLYSRLHLIYTNPLHLRIILWTIIISAIVLHSTTTVMIYGVNSSNNPSRFYKPYEIVEKTQVTIFVVQEMGISFLYIWAAFNMFRNSTLHRQSSRSRMLWRLVAVNTVVIVLNFTILALEYAGLYKLQMSYKALAYSVKLKIEFSILNELVNLTSTRDSAASSSGGQSWSCDDPFRNNSRADSYQPSLSLNTITEEGRGIEEQKSPERYGMKKSFKAVAIRFTSAQRSTNRHVEPAHNGITLQTMGTDITPYNEIERVRENGEASTWR